MDFYHTWVYEYVFNTIWFVWIIIVLVLGGNLVSPVILWFLMSGKSIPFTRNRKDKVRQG